MRKGALSFAIVTEADNAIGAGHLWESIKLAEHLESAANDVLLVILGRTPDSLMSAASECLAPIRCKEFEDLPQVLAARSVQVLVTNLRRISKIQVDALRNMCSLLVCIDELGGRFIEPDIIVNNSIVGEYHDYKESKAKIFAGPQYISIGREYQAFNRQLRNFSGAKNVIVSMGGTNPSQSTLRIVEALHASNSETKINVVAGSGFEFVEHLESLSQKNYGKMQLHKGLNSIAHLLAGADVGITVGGNTLYELACVGTPAIVLYEEAHERKQAETFSASGFGVCLGEGSKIGRATLLEALRAFDDPTVLLEHSRKGQQLVDGLGMERIACIVEESMQSARISV